MNEFTNDIWVTYVSGIAYVSSIDFQTIQASFVVF